jgi:AraC-like DNA-binding protein
MSEAISVHHGEFGRAALYKLDKTIVTHAHREGHLIFYLSGAEAKVNVSGNWIPANKSTGVAVSPWEQHSFHPQHLLTEGPCLCLVLYIKPIWFLENGQSAEFALNFGSAHISMSPDVLNWVRRLTSLLLDGGNEQLFDGYLYRTTQQCFEQSWRNADRNSMLSDIRRRFSDYRVRRSLRLMQENYTEEIEVEWLAREVGLSRPHFFKLFKKQMGITPNLYLNTLRAEQAISDLMTTEKSVTEISYDLGFSSQASFTRFFSSNVGIPPSDYRRVAHVG